MPKSKIILCLGFFIALLPVLGFPHSWESFFEVVCGLGIVLLSFLIAIDKRLMQKGKAERRHARRKAQIEMEVVTPPPVTAIPLPSTGRRAMRYGRRVTEPTVPPLESPAPEITESSDTAQ